MLVKLPAPILRESLKFLDSKDVLSTSLVGKSFHKMVDHDAVYEHMFCLEYPLKHLIMGKPHHTHWKDHFQQALQIFIRMRKAFRAICNANKKENYAQKVMSKHRKVPDFVKKSPNVNIEICSFFKCLDPNVEPKHLVSMFGELKFYDRRICQTPMFELFIQSSIVQKLLNDNLFPLVTDFSNYFVCVDLANRCGKGSNAVVGFRDGSVSMLYMFPNVVSYLEDMAQKFAGGYYTNAKNSGAVSLFKREPDSRTITNGICIECVSAFVPQESKLENKNYNKFFYTYQVRITASEDAQPAQLDRREWIIKAEGEPVDTVQGPGVIGFYPEVYPGCPEFVYESCVTHNKPVGSMEGGFYFIGQEFGNEIFAQIEPFEQRLPNNYEIIYLDKPI